MICDNDVIVTAVVGNIVNPHVRSCIEPGGI